MAQSPIVSANDFASYRFTTFSGADIVCSITVPILTNDLYNQGPSRVSRPLIIGNLQTISISTHRDKFPVRAFGSVKPKGFTRGVRIVAGSLIFTMFDRDALREVRETVQAYYRAAHKSYVSGYNSSYLPSLVPLLNPDELPPFDVTVTGINDDGKAFVSKLISVEIIDTGHVMGIDDLMIEETMSYMAVDFQPPVPLFKHNSGSYAMSGPDKGSKALA